MEFVLIPPGEFLMGSLPEEQTRFLEEESTTSSLFGTFSAAAGGVLASNKISSSAEAWIDYSDDYQQDPEPDDASAGGTISLLASDDAGIYANCKIVSSSMTTNDGGASILQEGMWAPAA